jgi:hypothetical protein
VEVSMSMGRWVVVEGYNGEGMLGAFINPVV